MSKLFEEEDEILEEFQKKIDDKSYSHEDVIAFKRKFEDQTAESQVMLRIGDRLQQRLDMANLKIKEKSDEIASKNNKLNQALDNLIKARVGKKASTIMFTITILLFISEEVYIEPLVEYFVGYLYLILILKGVVALILKSFESVLENIFVNREKKKIVNMARGRAAEEPGIDILGKTVSKEFIKEAIHNKLSELKPSGNSLRTSP